VTALITIRMGGSVVQACDARCYGAKHEPCTCVCAGECHGVGLVEAIAIIRRRHPEWIAAAGEDAEAELDDIVFQPPLFLIGDRMYVEFKDRYGVEVTVQPSPDFADTFALVSVGGASAKIDHEEVRQIRDGLTEWLTEIGAEIP
jgi:hypothetical protein